MTTSGSHFYFDALEPEHIEGLLQRGELSADEVVEGLWHGQVLVRKNAANGVRYLGATFPEPGEAMLRIVAKDASAEVRRGIVTATAQGIGSYPIAMPILFDATLDAGEGIRDTALEGLERRLVKDKPQAMPYFGAALSDVRAGVSAAASMILVKVGGVGAVPTLVDLLAHDDPRPRRAAFDILDRLRRLAVGPLIDALRSPKPRELARRLLGGLGEIEPADQAKLEALAADARAAGDDKLAAVCDELLMGFGRPIEVTRIEPANVPIDGFFERALDDRELGADVEIDEVLHALRDGRGVVRGNAVRWLGLADAAQGDSAKKAKVLVRLAPLVRDPDVPVRVATAQALGRLGGDAAVAALVTGLADHAAATREASVEALFALGPDALGGALDHVRAADPTIVERTFDGVREVATRHGAAVVHTLADALDGGRELTALAREVICLALGDIGAGAEDAVPALLHALRDPNEDVRAAAANALGFIGIDDEIVLGDLKRMLGDSVANVRRRAALAASRITGRPLDDRSPAEARVVPIADFETKVLDADALAGGVVAAGVESLVAALRDGREVVRQNAARALGVLAAKGGTGLTKAAQPLALALRDGEVDVRRAAATALGELGAAAAGAAWFITAGLLDPDADVRAAVIAALVALHPDDEPYLIEALRADRRAAEDGIFQVWYRLAGKGIGGQPGSARPSTAIEGLQRALVDASALIRENAARVLELMAKQGAAAALGALEARLADPVVRVRAAAQSAIDTIQGGKVKPPTTLEPDPIAIDGFFERLVDDAVLARATGHASPERLVRHLRDGRAQVRANAATLMGHHGASEALGAALPNLAVLARDEANEVRLASLTALGRLLDKGHAPLETYGEVLVHALSDRTKRVRAAASAALATLGERAFPALALGLARSDAATLGALEKLFVALGPPALDALPDALSELTPELHHGALVVLRAFAREALQALKPLLDPIIRTTTDPDVRAAALALADKIDGKDLEPAAAEPAPLPLPHFADALLSRASLAEAASDMRFDLLARAVSDGREIVRANAVTGLEVLGSGHELAWPLLVRALKDASAEVRVRAAEALKAAPPRRDVAFDLVKRLDDPSPRVIAAAEAALAAYGEFALDAFMYALDDRPELVGRAILPMLAGLADKAVDKLVIGLRYDSPLVRRNSLIGLRMLDKGLAQAARSAIAEARKDDEREVRLEALRTLDWVDGVEHVFLREPRTLPTEDFASEVVPAERLGPAARAYDADALGELLFDGRRGVRENAAAAHGLIGRYHPWLGILLKDSVGAVQVAAAVSLQQLGDKALPSARALVGALLEDEPEVRAAAKEALLGFGPKALPVLVEGLWVPPDTARRTVVPYLEALGKDATPTILDALDHPSQLVVLNALNVLGRLYAKDPTGAVKGIPKVTALIKNPLPAIIGAAQKCLFRLEGRTPAEFQKDPVPMPIIGFDKGPLSVDTLKAEAPALDVAWMISAFSDGRPIVRENAARAAGFMPTALKHLLAPLTIALKDAVPEVQVAAADAFAQLRAEDAAAIPALTFALRNGTERVKRACMVALDAYGPKRVATELVKHLVGREDWMLVTIAKVAARMAEVLVPALAEFAHDKEASLIARENAVRVLADLGQKARAAEPTLVKLLPDMEGMLACKAAFALGLVARPSKELIEAMQKRLEADPRPSLQAEVRSAVKMLKRRMPVGA